MNKFGWPELIVIFGIVSAFLSALFENFTITASEGKFDLNSTFFQTLVIGAAALIGIGGLYLQRKFQEENRVKENDEKIKINRLVLLTNLQMLANEMKSIQSFNKDLKIESVAYSKVYFQLLAISDLRAVAWVANPELLIGIDKKTVSILIAASSVMQMVSKKSEIYAEYANVFDSDDYVLVANIWRETIGQMIEGITTLVESIQD